MRKGCKIAVVCVSMVLPCPLLASVGQADDGQVLAKSGKVRFSVSGVVSKAPSFPNILPDFQPSRRLVPLTASSGRGGETGEITASRLQDTPEAPDQPVEAEQTSNAPTREQSSPIDDQTAAQTRVISFSVPLIYTGSVYGDVFVQIGPDQVKIEAASLRGQFAELLNEQGILALEQAIDGREYVTFDELAQSGFILEFDDNRLEVLLQSISGEFRPVTSLFNERSLSQESSLPVIAPAGFSAYLNVNGNVDYTDDGSLESPDLFLFGAARFEDIVLEVDGAFSGQFGPDYGFFRRSIRAIYDQPEKQRRFTAGDLRLVTIPVLRTPFVGGISIEKRRQIFDSFQPITRLNGREIFLDSRSTVNVLLNGDQYDSFQLEAGRYDLANLPLRTGANGVELEIIDSAGRRQIVDFDYFFEPLDLELGEDEYAFSLGVISREFNFEPDYTGDPIATGFYRRRLSENLILGGAVEISEDAQTVGSQMTLVPQVIPGVFDLEVAASFGGGTGLAARGGYRLSSGNSFGNRRQFSVTFDYESSGFQTLGQLVTARSGFLSLTASYSQSLSIRTIVSAGATLATFTGPRPDRKLLFVDVNHRLDDRLRLTAGIEYGDDFLAADSIGVRVGVIVRLGRSSRANADYRSRNSTTRLAISQGGERNVGSLGYDAGLFNAPGASNLTGNVNYVGNRFDARASVFSSGSSLSNITDRQRARLQFGTSIAVADGVFGVGRPISDSFAVLTPNPALGDREVISGRDLSGGDFFARSGFLGAAVQSDLNSYFSQTLRYDFDLGEDGAGFAVVDGISRVEPGFRSGYKIIVGDNRFVSVAATLSVGDAPAELWSGTVSSLDDEGFTPLRFFTNSFGRFAIIGLAPGKTYQINVPAQNRTFEITVPEDSNGVLNLGKFSLPEQTE